ncbi:MAG: GldG family protein [Bacteroidia bacterium]
MKSSKLFITAALVLGIVVVINLLLSQFSLRFDLSEGGQYTLSKATKTVLKDLEEPITVKAYFSEGLNPEFGRSRTNFLELLQEYSALSSGNVVYEFIDPNKDDEAKQEAAKAGVQGVMVTVREKNETTQQQGFMGAVLELGEEKEVIPFVQPGAPVEYLLTTSIKKLSVIDKPSIGFIQGHGEAPVQEMMQAAQNLAVLYNIEPLDLDGEENIPLRFETLALVRPTDSFPPSHLQKLEGFLGRGGKLFVALNRVKADLQTLQGTAVNTGVEDWFQQKGINVTPGFVVDATCGTIGVQQQMGFFTSVNQVKFPYFPIAQKFPDHPITKGLEQVIFQFVSQVKFTGDTSLTFTPIAYTSKQSGSIAAPTYFDIQKQWTDIDFPQSKLTIGAVLEGNIVNGVPSKIVVIGDGDFPINGPRQQFQQLQPDNVSLLVNSIDWLSDDTGLIDLRTKAVASRPIDQLEEGTQNTLKYLNFLLPIFLVILVGFIRAQRKKAIRKKRMNERYVKQ